MPRSCFIAAVGVAGLMAAGTIVPAHAAVPAKARRGSVGVEVARGCSARLAGPGKKGSSHKVPASGVVGGLAPGTYRLKASPHTCKARPSKVKVKKGKTAAARVLNDPRVVPTTLSGTFSGRQETPMGNTSFTWSGQITLTLSSVSSYSQPEFSQLALYRVTAASGRWDFSGGTSCTYLGKGDFTTADIKADSEYFVNPWNGYTYAFHGLGSFVRQLQYTSSCGGEHWIELAFPLVTNDWRGSEQLPPLHNGPQFSGTYQRDNGTAVTTWDWNLQPGPGVEYSKP